MTPDPRDLVEAARRWAREERRKPVDPQERADAYGRLLLAVDALKAHDATQPATAPERGVAAWVCALCGLPGRATPTPAHKACAECAHDRIGPWDTTPPRAVLERVAREAVMLTLAAKGTVIASGVEEGIIARAVAAGGKEGS